MIFKLRMDFLNIFSLSVIERVVMNCPAVIMIALDSNVLLKCVLSGHSTNKAVHRIVCYK